jgi:hypothetical protein
MGDHPRLFVSHSSLDANLTRQVCHQLAADYDVLVDYSELKPGVGFFLENGRSRIIGPPMPVV